MYMAVCIEQSGLLFKNISVTGKKFLLFEKRIFRSGQQVRCDNSNIFVAMSSI